MRRVAWIDILKGIGIFLVVWGHSNLLLTSFNDFSYITKYIYSFHMPLFFFISGYLNALVKNKSFRQLITRKTNTLIIPYLSFSIITVLIDIIRFKSNLPIRSELFKFFYIGKRVLWNDPLWFLICLFIVEIIFYGVSQLPDRKYSFLGLLIITLLGFWLSYKNITLPFGLSIAFIGTSFYGLGDFVSSSRSPRISKMVIVSCILISFIIPIYFNTTVSMYFMRYGNPIYFYISALVNIYLYLKLSQRLQYINFVSNIFQYLGRNSLIILCTHFTLLLLLRVCISRIPTLGSLMINSDPMKGLIYTTAVLAISIPIIAVIRNRFPFVIGIKS
ncbi:acyltransferase family protein [Desulfosporosinus orientis]|nr:acyltransferase family protein [Desulfosporosinus orientis]